MARSRFVRPDVTVLHISEGDTLTVKRRLNAGEHRAMFARMYLAGVDGQLRSGCEGGGGTYGGDGSSCADTPPPCGPTGACCVAPGDCRENYIKAQCDNLSGTFHASQTCAAAGC